MKGRDIRDACDFKGLGRTPRSRVVSAVPDRFDTLEIRGKAFQWEAGRKEAQSQRLGSCYHVEGLWWPRAFLRLIFKYT